MTGQRLALISAAVPPAIDGIGDHTARLAGELAKSEHGLGTVTILTAADAAARADPIEGVTIQGPFVPSRPSTVRQLLDALIVERPDWVVLQYNPFCYGGRGLNLRLPRAMASLRRLLPGTRLAVMFHELYVPVINLRSAVMTTWQRWQFRQLGRAADVLFFSMQGYLSRHREWFPTKPMYHLPVGSNMPRIPIDREEARARLRIRRDDVVLGVFGNAHVARPFSAVAIAARAIRQRGHRPRVLYIGADGDTLRATLETADRNTAITDGPLTPDEVSRRLSAIDLALSTYSDGVSTRRGAMMAALQHGLCVVGTNGINTDPELRAADGQAIALTAARDDAAFAVTAARLAEDPLEQRRLGDAARAFYEQHYDWPRIATRMIDKLR